MVDFNRDFNKDVNIQIIQEETINCGKQNTFAYSTIDVKGVKLMRRSPDTVSLQLTVDGTVVKTLERMTDNTPPTGTTVTKNYSNVEVSIPAGSTIDLKLSNTSYMTLTKTTVRITGKS